MKKLNLAIIGQGRSGKGIHGLFLASDENTYFNVKYVVDADEGRRKISKEMYPGCETFADYRELFNKDDIDLVTNASFSQMHYEITKDLLKHGLNVLCEKPFARNRYECEDLIKTAKENNALLTVFHQSLLSPMHLMIKDIVKSGKIGKPLIVNLRYNGFSRRWDWQTLQSKMAGSVYNTGPHPLGIGMDLMDFSDDIRVAYSYLDCALTSGDGEDVAKIILQAPGKPVVDIEINSNDAFSDYNVKIQGSKGTLKSTQELCKLKYIVDGENKPQPVIEDFLRDENNNPIYCSEDLITHEEEIDIPGSVFTTGTKNVYENIYYAITKGEELKIKAEDIAKLIGVIETVHGQNPLPVKF